MQCFRSKTVFIKHKEDCLSINLKDTEIYESSCTKKYHDHVPCSYAFKVVCIDNRFSKSIVVYRGRNAAYEFIKAILEEY